MENFKLIGIDGMKVIEEKDLPHNTIKVSSDIYARLLELPSHTLNLNCPLHGKPGCACG